MHVAAEARATFNQGRRLARKRDAAEARAKSNQGRQPRWHRGAAQPVDPQDFVQSLSWHDQRLLDDFDSGALQHLPNWAMVRAGHGRLRRGGAHLDTGGSTGGASRRLIDDWEMPDFRQFLGEEALG